MNNLLRYYVGYRVNLSKNINKKVNKNKIKDKVCFGDNMEEKYDFGVLIDKIQNLNNSLSYWLGNYSFNVSEECLPKLLDFKTIKIENLEFLIEDELSKLMELDLKFSNLIKVSNFEREVLLKKKDKALKSLDIGNAINYVKLIEEVDSKLRVVKQDIENIEEQYKEDISSYMSIYQQFVFDVASKDVGIEELYNNTNYTKKIVSVYRFNKIYDMIVECCEYDCLYELFENQDIKKLLGDIYFQIKQKVNKYVGANS